MDNLTIATTVSMVIAVVSVALAIYTASYSLPKINQSMTIIQKRLSTSEITAESAFMLTKISTLKWDIYKQEVQQEASNYRASEETCLELKSSGEYVLTSAGNRLLDPCLRKRIVDIRKLEPKIKEKDIILTIGVRDLVKIAFSKAIPPNVLAGIIITYLEET